MRCRNSNFATLVCLSIASTNVLANVAASEAASPNIYEIGQLWECTVPYKDAPPTERLQFFVTGKALKREISTRENFQTDDVIVSVALVDQDPKACRRVRAFRHLGFDKASLDRCVPKRLPDSEILFSEEYRQRLDVARISWLMAMKARKELVIGLSPSRFLDLVRRKRCG